MSDNVKEIRLRILESAYELFFAFGYSAVTVDLIAEKASVSKRTLYKYFESKEVLARAVFTELSRSVVSTFVVAESADVSNYLLYCCGIIRTTYRAMKSLPPKIHEDFEKNAPIVYQEYLIQRRSRARHTFSELVKAGVAAGCIQERHDTDHLIELFLTTWDAMYRSKTIGSIAMDPAESFKRAFLILLRGLLKAEYHSDLERFWAETCENLNTLSDSPQDSSRFMASV